MTRQRPNAITARDRRIDLLFLLGLVLAAVPIAVLGWVETVGPPANDLAVVHPSADHWFVGSIPIGGPVWTAGVRPGMEIIGIEPVSADPAGPWDSVLITDGTIRIGIPRQQVPPGSDALIVSVFLLALAVVASSRLPTVAWTAALASTVIATLTVTMLLNPPLSLALLLCGPLAGGVFAADRRRRPHERSVMGAGLLIVAMPLVWLVAYLAPFDDWRQVIQLSAAATMTLTIAGLLGVVRHAWQRGRMRLLPSHSFVASLGVLADELVPGRARSRVLAIEAERAELASELHADVLPELSMAIRSVEAGADRRVAADQLRSIASELRGLMNERRLGLLDESGLVAALEWLAERVEEQTGVTVELDISSHEPGESRPPRDVEQAAYRIAQQALDNALLHAHPATVGMRIDIHGEHVSLVVDDDGPGIDADAPARALQEGHVGVADMRQRAEAIGGSLFVGRGQVRGTRVAFRWPA